MVDITITIKIQSANVTDFINGFNKAIERPPKYQHLTDKQFIKQYIQDVLNSAYKTGKIKIAQETTTPEITEDIVNVS